MPTPERESYQEHNTRAAEIVRMLMLMDEEHMPLPEAVSPGELLARVLEKLGQAAFVVSSIYDDMPSGSRSEGSTDEREPGPLNACAYFGHVAVSALGAIARVHPQLAGDPLSAVKDHLLDALDEDVAEWVEDNHETYESAEPDFWVRGVVALLVGAAGAVRDVSQVSTAAPGGLGLDEEALSSHEDDLPMETETDEAFADSLMDAARMAAVACQWFEEMHLEQEAP